MTTLKDIAKKTGFSTATVSRALNNSGKVRKETKDIILKAASEMKYQEDPDDEKETTIKDVARLSGVSEATVSRVINKKEDVTEETREKVEKAIKKLDYRVNINARNFRKSKTRVIGLLIPDILISFYGNLLKGIQNLAYEHNYTVVLLETDGSLQKEIKCIDFLKDRRADGMIYIGKTYSEGLVQELHSCNFPVVLISGEEKNMGFPIVKIDNFKASYDMAKYLINKGYKKIAFISGPLNEKIVGAKRYQGYISALEESNIPVVENYIAESDFSLEGGYSSMLQILKSPELPEAVFAAGDEMALGAMRAINEKNLSVPEDIAVAGFDNIRLSRFVTPALTTVSQPIYDIGQTAMGIVLDIIKGKKLDKNEFVLDYELLVRESS